MNSKGRILKKVGLKFESIFKVLLSVYEVFDIFRVEAGASYSSEAGRETHTMDKLHLIRLHRLESNINYNHFMRKAAAIIRIIRVEENKFKTAIKV